MGAARLYDNSYIERQETAALAQDYLKSVEKTEVVEEKIEIKTKKYLFSNIIGITTSLLFCAVLLLSALLPLLKETQVQKMKVGFSVYKEEIRRLEKEIDKVETEIDEKIKITNIDKIAREKLGLREATSGQTYHLVSNEIYSLSDKSDESINILENLDIANK